MERQLDKAWQEMEQDMELVLLLADNGRILETVRCGLALVEKSVLEGVTFGFVVAL